MSETPVVVYGHFNRKRGFGVIDYYPDASQFITILRDPFEQMVSAYYYLKNVGHNWKDKSRLPKDGLKEFLLSTTSTMFDLFPQEVTMENYKEIIERDFIEIGATEQLTQSMQRIANKLGKVFNHKSLGFLNVTENKGEVPNELKEEFMKKNPVEYAVYNYVIRSMKFSDAPPN